MHFNSFKSFGVFFLNFLLVNFLIFSFQNGARSLEIQTKINKEKSGILNATEELLELFLKIKSDPNLWKQAFELIERARKTNNSTYSSYKVENDQHLNLKSYLNDLKSNKTSKGIENKLQINKKAKEIQTHNKVKNGTTVDFSKNAKFLQMKKRPKGYIAVSLIAQKPLKNDLILERELNYLKQWAPKNHPNEST